MPKQSKNSKLLTSGTAKAAARSARAALPTWIAATVLALAIAFVYGRALDAPFIFDDRFAIVENSSIKMLWPLVGTDETSGPLNPPPELPTSGRPLVNLSFAMNYFVGRLNPVGYHLVNIILHFLSASLVWAILDRTLRLPYFAGKFDTSAGWIALTVAIIWAIHPLQTEAVTYVTQRTELMVTFFYLATIYCSLRYWSNFPLPPREGQGEGSSSLQLPLDALLDIRTKRRRHTWLVLAVLACSAGMASKEIMVSAPLVVLLFERTFIAGSLTSALRRSWPLYAGLTATWLLLLAANLSAPRGESAGFGLGISAYEWWLTQAKVFSMYLKLAVWPSPLLFHYELPYLTTFAHAWPYVVAVLLIGIAVLILIWQNHPVGFLGALMFAVLSPTFVVPIVSEMAAERRMYLPLLSLVTVAVVGVYLLAQFVENRWGDTLSRVVGTRLVGLPLISFAILLVLMCGVVSAKRLTTYYDERALWREVVQHQPDNSIAHNNLGDLLINSGHTQDAIKEFQSAVAINPDYVRAFNNLGIAFMRLGRYPEAIENLEHALRIDPEFAEAHQILGNTFARMGRNSEAIEHLELALKLRPDFAEAHDNLGVVLATSGQIPQAIDHLRQAAWLNPNSAHAHKNLGVLLDKTGQGKEAVAHFQTALQIARSMGQHAQADEIERLLKHHQVEPLRSGRLSH